MKSKPTLLLVFLISLFTISCSSDYSEKSKLNNYNKDEFPKYIFLFIGDGMSFTQVNLAKAAYLHPDFRLHKKPEFGEEPMNLLKLPITGVATTFAADRYITESAAAATALATGNKTTCGTVSLNQVHTDTLKTIAEMAHDKGMKVGIISSVSIDHATPACFYAHEKDRGQYNSIAAQMASSGFDYFGGGFARGALPSSLKKENAIDITKVMKKAGYSIVTSKNKLTNIKPGQKCWAYNKNYDPDAALLYEIDQPSDYLRLADFTAKGIELLQNEKGFFMMVESGKIDWACHANDGATAAHEVVALDESLAKALEFYHKHPNETLIIVTGDHECGGLALGYSATHYESAYDILGHQKISFQCLSRKVRKWKKSSGLSQDVVMDSIKHYFGLDDTLLSKKLKLSQYEFQRLSDAYEYSFNKREVQEKEAHYIKFGGYDPLTVTVTHILNQKAGIDWASYSHTAVPVPIYSIGCGSTHFTGQLDNIDIAKKIIKLARLK